MRKKLLTIGALTTSMMPIFALVSCAQQEPIEFKIQTREKETIALEDEDLKTLNLVSGNANSLKNELAAFNQAIEQKITEKGNEYFQEVATIIQEAGLEKIDAIEGNTAVFQALSDYAHEVAILDLNLTISLDGNELGTISQTFDIFNKNGWDEILFTKITSANINQSVVRIKNELLGMKSFKVDQYDLLKNSSLIDQYVKTIVDQVANPILMYQWDEPEYPDPIKVTWSDNPTEAKKWLEKMGSEYKII